MAAARASAAAVDSMSLPTPTPAAAAPPSSTWDRLSTWASENKAAAWTIAGVTVVITGGTIYYLSTSGSVQESKPVKKAKKKAKGKDAEMGSEAPSAKEGRLEPNSETLERVKEWLANTKS